jgi:hypothetical protein
MRFREIKQLVKFLKQLKKKDKKKYIKFFSTILSIHWRPCEYGRNKNNEYKCQDKDINKNSCMPCLIQCAIKEIRQVED